ncbi:hypothetical protein EJ08DRAFT_181229 [Tothia fuscella]|uniref:Protein BNI4 n=1 Tax=Tothia fuscella TaxID=1048955 RepID=A0A9P4NUH7_9PEZI|nr:hypothetical protein EJ08DRAFT_181229 [Tothia fuscella]
MAEVLVSTQTIGNIMLHSPPDTYHHNSSSGQSHHNNSRGQGMPRSYSSHNVGLPYRGASATPVAPYAFQSTPHLRQDNRTVSASNSAHRQSIGPQSLSANRHKYTPSSSDSTASSTSASNSSAGGGQYSLSKDDSVLVGQRPLSQFGTPTTSFLTSSSTPDLSLTNFEMLPKPSPDRYRRSVPRGNSSNSVNTSQQTQDSTKYNSANGGQINSQVNLANTNRTSILSIGGAEEAQTARRYRRKSVAPSDISPIPTPVTQSTPTWSQVAARGHAGGHPTPPTMPTIPVVSAAIIRPVYQHQRNNSGTSTSSTGSANANRPSSAMHDSSRQTRVTSPSLQQRPRTAPGNAPRKSANTGSSDMPKRVTTPSPLSNPMTSEPEKNTPAVNNSHLAAPAQTAEVAEQTPSPAVQQLQAINDPKKPAKSRLRRAFSFGSAQELRRATAENNAGRAKLHKQMPGPEISAEDAAIAAKQEAGGIGAGIYSGQGVVYSSTDNLSISSTASSASIMLRKMGQGMKKSSRSLKGLFRPKSVIGVPAADSAVTQPAQASTAEVSHVTVEAERERVNVNADPHDQVGGGTAYPKLERNSMDAMERPTSSRHGQHDSISSRKSIVGGDRERQDVLAAVKKGILKRAVTTSNTSNTSSPVMGSSETEVNPPSIPGTPDEPVNMDNLDKDYFVATAHFAASSTRSLPERGGLSSRNISWNPKVQFHEVYTANEYDRRGEIATCNRLTPMLAQQIKEELNSFKMEMEVHEASKPHTHFF